MTRETKERLFLDLLPMIRAAGRTFARRAGYPVDDIVQEASIAAWVGLDSYDASKSQPWTYAAHCIHWHLLTYWRRAHNKSRFADNRPATLTDEPADHRLNEYGSSMEFEELISVCSEVDRDVVLLRYRDGLTQQETGERLGITHQRVQVKEKRALGRMRERRTDLRRMRVQGR
jgi:RNA polymerase sigma factor (sigma-70 family)